LPTDPLQDFLTGLPFEPDPFQWEALQALSAGRSVLVAAPTGTGKTVVAEFAVHLALSRGLRAIYTTPIKALSNQKFRDFRSRYGEEPVGLLTGDLAVNPGGRLLVMTTEVARNMLIQNRGSFRDVGCLIFDEVHYLADPERGTAWEESILLAPPYVPLVCLSATVANASEVAEWIRTTGRDVALVESSERAVPLKHRYYLDGHLLPILEKGISLAALPQPAGGERTGRVRVGGAGWGNGSRNAGEELPPDPAEVVRSLAAADLLPAIYFLFSRKAVEEAADACQRLNLLPYHQAAEVRLLARRTLDTLPAEDRSLTQVERLMGLLPKGIGFHHAGLLPPLKTLVEELLASGRLKAVFATDTLALGINVPARAVVVGEMIKFDGQGRRLLSPGEYRQLTGRAGRRGMDTVGYSVLLHSPWAALDRVLEIATGEVAPLESAFRPAYSTVLNLWESLEDEDRLARLIAGSLRQFQEGSKIRALVREREELLAALARIPTGCPLDGGPMNWLVKERTLERERERAESALESARRHEAAIEESIRAWPWRYTKSHKREWLRTARPGEMAYSRRLGWMAFLGPSSEGVGLFLADRQVARVDSYSDLDYLPDPSLAVEVPEGVARRCALTDGAATNMDAREVELLAHAMGEMSLPDLERVAAEACAAARRANKDALAAVRERVEAAQERLRAISRDLAQSPCHDCPRRAEHRRSERLRRHYSGMLASAEHELEAAREESRRRAERTMRSLRSVLESFGYMAAGRPTAKARALRRLFDSNSLIISELLDWGVLGDASAVELAEAASWFAFDREGSGRALAITERLARMRVAAEAVAKRVLEVERRFSVDLSHPLAPDFKGVALAWATGMPLATLSARSGLAEGDIVFVLQKTIDLCRQLQQAAPYCRTPSLSRRASEAERLLRRGVVDSYYRWIVSPGQALASNAVAREDYETRATGLQPVVPGPERRAKP